MIDASFQIGVNCVRGPDFGKNGEAEVNLNLAYREPIPMPAFSLESGERVFSKLLNSEGYHVFPGNGD